MTDLKHLGREVTLWLAGVLGALCLLATLAGWAFNITPLVFASGSMSPTYDTGALGIARTVPAAEVEVGDVVSVVDDHGSRVTHRVVSLRSDGPLIALRLKGDTNAVADEQTYQVRQVDRVAFGVPMAGYGLNLMASPFGLVAGASLAVAAIWLAFARPAGGRRRTSPLIPAGIVGSLVGGCVIGATGAAPWAFTSAYWTDSSTVTAVAKAPADDTTPPVLTNPQPANGATGTGWTAMSCTSSANQVCVTATDTGGSGIETVYVKLVRTGGTPQCWNGSGFVSGTSCAAQPMTLVSGNQYRSTGLTAAAMTSGAYQATYTAADHAGNQAAPLSVTFTITVAPPVAPVLDTCQVIGNGGNPYRLTWSWSGPGTPDNFRIYFVGSSPARAPLLIAGSPMQYDLTQINNETGTFRIVAVVNSVESAMSNGAQYAGNGGSKTCTKVP